jgi:phosphatidylglycerol:prolipoprotein diacylglycerol transferase
VVSTIIGARLGHVIFYDPQIFWENPLGVFLPFEFSPFRFTGLQGLASHGAAIGILFALWLYSRKKKPGQNYLQILDRIVILVALTGALIRLGNFFNSEIIGTPSDAPTSVVFVNRLTEAIKDKKADSKPIVETVAYHKNESLPSGSNGRMPISIYVFFKPGVDEMKARNFIQYTVNDLLINRLYEHFDQNVDKLDYELTLQKDGTYGAKINTFGIARHPAQLYESISSLLLFVFLFMIWYRYKQNLPTGLIFGLFMIILWTLRFVYEFLKEPQESFEQDLPLFMGQILSIPMVIVGIIVLIYTLKNKNKGTPDL